jgi:hypoxanthine phosphoribosyltransferase
MGLAELISSSEVIFSNNEIETSIGEMAETLNKTYRDQHVLVLPVLSGAIPFAGHLIPKLTFEVTINYFHASRYAKNIGTDILDQGNTLAFIKQRLLVKGALEVSTAVLFDKAIGKSKPIQADYIGLDVPDIYVYGFGLDFNGIGRNMADLYAYNN